MKRILYAAVLCALPLCATAQEVTERLDSAQISASRAGINTPVSLTNVSRDVLRAQDPSFSLPMALDLIPSVVTYNEGGTGLGNSAMTIRGSKGSQINVTLNGITLNDAESQEVFWINIPSLTFLASNVQVQRGLGTNMSGPGDFGASINMNTALVQQDPSGRFGLSAGSFGTRMMQASASTGLLPGRWYMDIAFSQGHTDGYIYNAFVNSASVFAALGWLGRRNSLRFTLLHGEQGSGITWDGIDLEQYNKDRRYNPSGNNNDNYTQTHLQLNYTHAFSPAFVWTNTLNFTTGFGYDEYSKSNRKLKSYGFEGAPEPARRDITYRKNMDNRLWVFNSALRYVGPGLSATAGVNLSVYRGGHWGQVLSVKDLPDAMDYYKGWYNYSGLKRDASLFARAEWTPLPWLTTFADLQYRAIGYSLTGADDDWLSYGANPADLLAYARVWRFFNPRLGVNFQTGPHRVYLTAAIGHREPGKGDIKDNVKGEVNAVEPEKMLDVELGYRLGLERFTAQANLYLMEYRDMLLETGRLSSSGYAIKENVPRSWRRGIELQAMWAPVQWLAIDGNATLSINQIADYTSFVPYDDDSGRVLPVHYGRTTMLMSPSIIGMGRVRAYPWKGGELGVNAKYVGKQFIDNSMREEMAIPAYWTAGASVSQNFSFGLRIFAHFHNIFNRMYYAAGWRWESYNEASDTIYSGIGVYPQPPFNFMVGLEYSF